MKSLKYQVGDATQPIGDGVKIITHVCNDIGAWGRGFVVAISKRWKAPELQFRAWHQGHEQIPFELGRVQFVQVEPRIWVANLIGQHGIRTRSRSSTPPVRYEAIQTGLRLVAPKAQALNASVHMPRIGAGLAGGDWETISKIIETELCAHGVETTVYDLPER